MRISFEHIAQRADTAVASFVATVRAIIHCSEDDARLVLRYYIAERLVKRDLQMSRYTVKHGAYLDADVLERAVGLARDAYDTVEA